MRPRPQKWPKIEKNVPQTEKRFQLNPSQNVKDTLPKKDQFNNTVETEIGLWLIEKSPKLVTKNNLRYVSNVDGN